MLLRKCGLSILLAISLSTMTIMQPFVIKEFYEGRPTQIYLLFHVLMLYGLLSFFQSINRRNSGSKRVKKRDIWYGLGLSGACLTYWFGGAAVGFCAGVVLLLSLCTKRRIQKMIFLLGFPLSVSCALLVTWRISTKMLMGEGKSLFPALNRKPLYEIDLGFLPSIPIQNVEHLENWNAFYVLLSKTLGLTDVFVDDACWGLVFLSGQGDKLAMGHHFCYCVGNSYEFGIDMGWGLVCYGSCSVGKYLSSTCSMSCSRTNGGRSCVDWVGVCEYGIGRSTKKNTSYHTTDFYNCIKFGRCTTIVEGETSKSDLKFGSFWRMKPFVKQPKRGMVG